MHYMRISRVYPFTHNDAPLNLDILENCDFIGVSRFIQPERERVHASEVVLKLYIHSLAHKHRRISKRSKIRSSSANNNWCALLSIEKLAPNPRSLNRTENAHIVIPAEHTRWNSLDQGYAASMWTMTAQRKREKSGREREKGRADGAHI